MASSLKLGGAESGVQFAAMRYNFDTFDNECNVWFESMRILFNRYSIQYLGDILGVHWERFKKGA